MSSQPHPEPDSAHPHPVRDALLTGLSVWELATAGPIPLPVVPNLVQTHDQATTQSVPLPTRDPVEADEAHLAEYRRMQQEQEQERALDLGVVLHQPIQVEQRPDTRSER